MTPGAILTLPERDASATATEQDRPDWHVRVVPNKYPALPAGDEPRPAASGLFQSLAADGAHEVVIESPDHVTRMSELEADCWPPILKAYRQRLAYWRADRRMRAGIVFKNVGLGGGASLQHVHSQLMALPLVPEVLGRELAGSARLFQTAGHCGFCRMAQEEESATARLVLQSPQFLAFCPFASCFAYETWIMPRAHQAHFDALTDAEAVELGDVLRRVISALEQSLPELAYNYVLHTTPFDTDETAHYHWHIEILPRVTRLAGFELGTGIFLNTVAPEDAARILRGALAA